MKSLGLLIICIVIIISCNTKVPIIKNSKEIPSEEYDKLIINDSLNVKIAIIHGIESVHYKEKGKLTNRDLKILKLLGENNLEDKDFLWLSDFQFENNRDRKLCFIYKNQNINLEKYYPKIKDNKPLYWFKKMRKGNFTYFQGIFKIKNRWISIVQYANLKYQPYYEGAYNTGKEFDRAVQKIEATIKLNQ